MLVLSLAVRWLECTLHIGMSLMLMITMVKDLRSMSEGFGWQRYKKYLYQSLSCRDIAFWNGKYVLQMVTRQRSPYKGLQVKLAGARGLG